MNRDTQKFIDLRTKIVKQQAALNKIGLPKTKFSKTELRSGLMGRAQRKENIRFLKEVKTEKQRLARQKVEIDRYLKRVEAIPAPRIQLKSRSNGKILGLPKLRKVRGRARTQIRRRKKR